ncbi:MAG TPA: cyclase family protein [Candidatus Binataceae bacterium]|nr:cyclase family protein [Candidatus Binataceae bacterium]
MSQALPMLLNELASGRVRIVDLTQPLSAATPVIPLPPQFTQTPLPSIEVHSQYDPGAPYAYSNVLKIGEHTGTHFDAPIHWVTGKDLPHNACDTIEPRRFVGPACVLDFAREAAANPDFLVTPDHILQWEREHGRIPAASWVLLRTDWSKKSGAAFLNMADDGPHTPGWQTATSRMLANAREVLGVGVETVGTDAGQSGAFDPPFSNHAIMHGAGRYGLASLCNLDQLPASGAIVIAAPLKIVQGSGSPARVLAMVPN